MWLRDAVLVAYVLLLASCVTVVADNTMSSFLSKVVSDVSLEMKTSETTLIGLAHLYRSGTLSHNPSARSRAVPRKVRVLWLH